MARSFRSTGAGLVFHVLNRAAKRTPLFTCADDYDAFEAVLKEAWSQFDVALFAYCVMPNHWHLLTSPRADGALSRCMHWMTTTHASRWNAYRGAKGEGAVYQGRFKAIPVSSDDHFLRVARYVERNALRAHLVERAEEWRWSSLWQRCHREADWLATWPVECPADWTTFVNEEPAAHEVEAIRRATVKNEPFGASTWREAIEARAGVPPRRSRGRPRRSQTVLKK
jgi:putative transposase